MAGIARLMTILANVLPGIERSVMPRWLEHVRASRFRFQNGRIIPLRQELFGVDKILTYFDVRKFKVQNVPQGKRDCPMARG